MKALLPLFLFFTIGVVLAIPSGSTISQTFPSCDKLNITIYSTLPMDENELEVFPNCELIYNSSTIRVYSCDCYNGYVSNIKIHPFTVNNYTILYSFIYSKKIPERIVKHVSHSTYIDERKLINITNITMPKIVYNITNVTNVIYNETVYITNNTKIEELSSKIEEIERRINSIIWKLIISAIIVSIIILGAIYILERYK